MTFSIKRRQRFRPSLKGFCNYSEISPTLNRAVIKLISTEIFSNNSNKIANDGGAYVIENDIVYGHTGFFEYHELMPFYQKYRKLIILEMMKHDLSLVDFVLNMKHNRLFDRDAIFATLYNTPREFNFIVVRAICLWLLQTIAIDWNKYILNGGKK